MYRIPKKLKWLKPTFIHCLQWEWTTNGFLKQSTLRLISTRRILKTEEAFDHFTGEVLVTTTNPTKKDEAKKCINSL